jgi:hypothetical protein
MHARLSDSDSDPCGTGVTIGSARRFLVDLVPYHTIPVLLSASVSEYSALYWIL